MKENVFIFDNNYVYANIPTRLNIENINFDKLLSCIGKYYYHEDNMSINRICARISEDLNREWRLNKFRKRKKRVSVQQIKSIRHSFIKMGQKDKYVVRIPFNVVSIFFYIMSLYFQIAQTQDGSISDEIMGLLHKQSVGNIFYRNHCDAFNSVYINRRHFLNDRTLVDKYELLYAELTRPDSFFCKQYSKIKWENCKKYIIC